MTSKVEDQAMWWESQASLHSLNRVFLHVRASRVRPWSVIERCRQLFDALNVAQSAFGRFSPVQGQLGEMGRFARLLTDGLSRQSQRRLLQSLPVMALANLDPPLMDMKVLRDSPGYWPGKERHLLNPQILNEATARQRNLREAMQEWASGGECAQAVRQLATYLYVLRSNIAHGEKISYPADLRDALRDAQICGLAVPALEEVLEEMFDQPRHRLAAYGTLRPGERNNGLLGSVGGVWESYRVFGFRNDMYGLPAFRWNPDSEETLAVDVLQSEVLPQAWPGIDAFEGPEYVRIVIPVLRDGGSLSVANIYERVFEPPV